ncbi:hypothetical protein V8G54_019066, partial [Vigna mungo]
GSRAVQGGFPLSLPPCSSLHRKKGGSLPLFLSCFVSQGERDVVLCLVFWFWFWVFVRQRRKFRFSRFCLGLCFAGEEVLFLSSFLVVLAGRFIPASKQSEELDSSAFSW